MRKGKLVLIVMILLLFLVFLQCNSNESNFVNPVHKINTFTSKKFWIIAQEAKRQFMTFVKILYHLVVTNRALLLLRNIFKPSRSPPFTIVVVLYILFSLVDYLNFQIIYNFCSYMSAFLIDTLLVRGGVEENPGPVHSIYHVPRLFCATHAIGHFSYNLPKKTLSELKLGSYSILAAQSKYPSLVLSAKDWGERCKKEGSMNLVPVPIEFNGNSASWNIAKVCMRAAQRGERPNGNFDYVRKSMSVAKTIQAYRSIHGGKPRTSRSFLESQETYLNLRIWAESLHYASSKAVVDERAFRDEPFRIAKAKIIPEIDDTTFYGPMESPIDLSKKLERLLSTTSGEVLKISHIINQYYVTIGEKVWVCDRSHIDRAIELVKIMCTLSLLLESMETAGTATEGLFELFFAMAGIADKNPQKVGEYIKASRNLIVAGLDNDNFFDKTTKEMLLDSMDSEKQEIAGNFVDVITSIFLSKRDQVNISHIFKCIPHPDANLRLVVDKVKGIREPNKTENGVEVALDGVLRKSLLLSMMDTGLDVRADFLSGDERLFEVINSSSKYDKRRQLMATPSSRFTRVTFAKARNMANFLEVAIPVSDKASAKDLHPTIGEINDAIKVSKETGLEESSSELIKKLRSINDIVTELKGESRLSSKLAWQKFQAVVRVHELFESRYPDKTPEEIPADDLEEFVKSLGDLSYTVLTEPKLGEKHKENTRLFYMAEQDLKKLTQLVERLARQISGKQGGVSIVKTSAARRRDIEKFADSMLGSHPTLKTIFISFDMSNFSMKFPMNLVRVYGKILGELTGHPELSRMDLFFRNSLVYHNTRGHFDAFAGVKGGFEGFLNFVWSSIHAAVMELALLEAGISGSLLAYSDDGLLQFNVAEDNVKEEVQRVVRSIQKTYSQCGLEFNLGKTIISSNVWEYLGEVCHEGHILDSWVKEACSFNTVEQTQGFNPVAHRQRVIVSQASSMARSKADSDLCELLALTESAMFLIRISPDMQMTGLLWSLILPQSCGGFRVPDAFELACTATIPSDSYFAADMQLLKLASGNEDILGINRIFQYLLENMAPTTGAVSAIAMGSRFKFCFPDVSGLGEAGRLVSLVRDRGLIKLNGGENPISGPTLTRLHAILTQMTSIEPTLIHELVVQTPYWKDYHDAMAIVMARSAIKILRHSDIRKSMTRDRNNVRKALGDLQSALLATPEKDYTFQLFYKQYMNSTMKAYNIAQIKPAPKIALSFAYNSPNPSLRIVISRSSFEPGTIRDLAYAEPTEAPKEHSPLLQWVSEYAATTKEARLRKFLRVIAAVYVSSPSTLVALQELGAVFGVDVPNVPHGTSNNAKRYRSYTMERPDITISAFTPFLSRASVMVGSELTHIFSSRESYDRTTYLASAKFYAVLHCQMQGLSKGKVDQQTPPISIDFLLSNPAQLMMKNLPMEVSVNYTPTITRGPTLQSVGIQKLEQEAMQRQFSQAIDDDIQAALAANVVRKSTSFDKRLMKADAEKVAALMSKAMGDWMRKIIFGKVSPGAMPLITMPLDPMMHQGVMRTAIMELLEEYLVENASSEYYKLVEKVAAGHNYRIDLILSDKISSFQQILHDLCSYVPSSVLSHDYLHSVFTLTGDDWRKMSRLTQAKMIFSRVSIPVIIVERSQDASSMATQGRVASTILAVKRAVDYIYNSGKANDWDQDKMGLLQGTALGYGKTDQLDWFLDISSLYTSKLRASEHRSAHHQVNQKTLRIEMFKLCFITNIMSTQLGRYKSIDQFATDMSLLTLPGSLSNHLMEYLKIEKTNVDHHMMLTGPLDLAAGARVKYYARQLFRKKIIELPRHLYFDKIEPTMSGIIRNLSAYNATITTCVVNRQQIYTPSTAQAIISDFHEYKMSDPKTILTTPTKLVQRGQMICTGRFDKSLIQNNGELSAVLIGQLCHNAGVIQARVSDSVPNTVTPPLHINTLISSQHGPFIVCQSESERQLSIYLVGYRFHHESDLAAMMNYLSEYRACKIVVYDDGEQKKGRYCLVGAVYSSSGLPAVKDLRINHHNLSPDSARLDDYLVRSVPDWISAGYIGLGWRRSTTEQPIIRRQAIFPYSSVSVGQARKVTKTYSLQTNRDALVAACAIITGVTSPAAKYAAYALLLLDIEYDGLSMKIGENRTSFKKRVCSLLLEIADEIQKLSENELAMMVLHDDVSKSLTWLSRYSVTGSITRAKGVEAVYAAVEETISEFPNFKAPSVVIAGQGIQLSQLSTIAESWDRGRPMITKDNCEWMLSNKLWRVVDIGDISKYNSVTEEIDTYELEEHERNFVPEPTAEEFPSLLESPMPTGLVRQQTSRASSLASSSSHGPTERHVVLSEDEYLNYLAYKQALQKGE